MASPKPLGHVASRFSVSGGRVELQSSQPRSSWWHIFASAELDDLCSRALAGNLDLRRAGERIKLAAAIATQRGATLLPSVTLNSNVSASRQNFFFGGSGPRGGALSVTQVSFPLTLAVNWEIDLWGRTLNQRRAATRDVVAAAQDQQAIAISLTAQIADVWLRLLEANARLTLLKSQQQLNQELLELTRVRFGQGQASAVDVLQQAQQVEAIIAQRPGLKLAAELANHQLRALLGQAPQTTMRKFSAQTTLPELPPLPAMGVPMALLNRRPDVRAAQQRLVAADHRLGSAKAGLLPALRVGGSTGFQGRVDPFGFLQNFVWNLFGGIAAPLFQGGQLRAEVARNRALVRDALLAYTQVVQRALWEVENALTQERRQGETLATVHSRLVLARTTLKQSRRRFAAGQSTYLPVAQAVATRQRLEAERIGAQRQLLSTRIQLYRALAGSIAGSIAGSVAAKPKRRSSPAAPTAKRDRRAATGRQP